MKYGRIKFVRSAYMFVHYWLSKCKYVFAIYGCIDSIKSKLITKNQ